MSQRVSEPTSHRLLENGRKNEVSERTVIAPLTPDGAKRLRTPFDLLSGNFAGALAVGTVDDMRFVFLDNDTRLLFTTAYDGEWDPYLASLTALDWLADL